MKKIFLYVGLTFFVISLSVAAQEKKPVIIINDWTTQIVLSHITQKLLLEIGIEATTKKYSTADQWSALRYGLADIQIEVWEGTMAKEFNEGIGYGRFTQAGSHSALTREDWWYPDYVEELCPGLPNWSSLKNCAEIFATEETKPDGRYLGGPWEKPDRGRIRALNLPFKVVKAKDGTELREKLLAAVAKKEPILLFNWTPNWVEAKIKGKFVEFPEYAPECETDERWGISEKWLYDCGNPRDGWLKKAVSNQFKQKHYCGFLLIQNIMLNNRDFSELAYKVDVEKKSYVAAANEWLSNNHDKWRKWLPTYCQLNR